MKNGDFSFCCEQYELSNQQLLLDDELINMLMTWIQNEDRLSSLTFEEHGYKEIDNVKIEKRTPSQA